ncbi:DNA polymerase III subunit beta [Candidatus Saganbacteria bacterium]|nr:DNA polymerase III subunit beta [Candidatus Saganbacteria bacterium]
MEFIINKSELSYGVSLVERVVATRSTLPIIGNILFEVTKSGLKLSANNLEMGIEVTLKAKVLKEGSILIPAKTLSGIVSKLPDDDISFKLKDKGLIGINYKKSNFNIHGLPPDEFPQLPKVKETKSISVEGKVLIDMIGQTVFSASTSEDKYVLNGILIETGKSAHDSTNLRMVATDGYRLSKSGVKVEGLADIVSVIVPSKSMGEILRILSQDPDGTAKITIGPDQMSFKYKDTFLVSRLIQGQFPDYRQVIPKSTETKITIDLQSFLSSVERAAVIASQSANIVKIEVKAGQLHIMAQAPDVGSVDEVIEVEIKGKEKGLVAFNVRLLADALKVMDTDKVVLELGEALSPGLIRPKDGTEFVYIVMPIRTQEVAA